MLCFDCFNMYEYCDLIHSDMLHTYYRIIHLIKNIKINSKKKLANGNDEIEKNKCAKDLISLTEPNCRKFNVVTQKPMYQ